MTHHCTAACTPWTGTNKCHCSSCGQTFSVITHFDKHRDKGKCLAPTEIGLVQNSFGVWRAEGETDIGERFKRKEEA